MNSFCFFMLLHTTETPNETFSCFCTRQKHQMKLFHASAHCRKTKKKISVLGESRFPKGLVFPRMAKVISRKVWHFRARRKSFPERFGISAPGESHFLKGLAFPRLAKVVSQKVWHFRAWRKSFPKRFSISALGESHFPNGLAFPRSAKVVSQKVWHFRARRKSFRNNLFKIVTIKIHK